MHLKLSPPKGTGEMECLSTRSCQALVECCYRGHGVLGSTDSLQCLQAEWTRVFKESPHAGGTDAGGWRAG